MQVRAPAPIHTTVEPRAYLQNLTVETFESVARRAAGRVRHRAEGGTFLILHCGGPSPVAPCARLGRLLSYFPTFRLGASAVTAHSRALSLIRVNLRHLHSFRHLAPAAGLAHNRICMLMMCRSAPRGDPRSRGDPSARGRRSPTVKLSKTKLTVDVASYTVALIEFASRSLPAKVHLTKKSGGRKTRR
jgi:hypothetical protein